PRAASLLRLRRGGSDGVERECAAGGAAATGGDQRASADCHGGCDTCPTTLPHRAQCSRAALPGRGFWRSGGGHSGRGSRPLRGVGQSVVRTVTAPVGENGRRANGRSPFGASFTTRAGPAWIS